MVKHNQDNQWNQLLLCLRGILNVLCCFFASKVQRISSAVASFCFTFFHLLCNYFCEFRSFPKFIHKHVESPLKIWNSKIEVDIDNVSDEKVSEKKIFARKKKQLFCLLLDDFELCGSKFALPWFIFFNCKVLLFQNTQIYLENQSFCLWNHKENWTLNRIHFL